MKEEVQDVQMEEDKKPAPATNGSSSPKKEEPQEAPKTESVPLQENGGQMDVDDEGGPPAPKEEVKKPAPSEPVVQTSTVDEDDAVEY